MLPGHLLHSALTSPSSADAPCLKSRHPFVSAAQELISSSDNNNIRAAHWAEHQWSAELAGNPKRLARTSNNRVIMACELYSWLLRQCEALRTCCSDFSDRNNIIFAKLALVFEIFQHLFVAANACNLGFTMSSRPICIQVC